MPLHAEPGIILWLLPTALNSEKSVDYSLFRKIHRVPMNLFAQQYTFQHFCIRRNNKAKLGTICFEHKHYKIYTKLLINAIPSLWGVNAWLQVNVHYFEFEEIK